MKVQVSMPIPILQLDTITSEPFAVGETRIRLTSRTVRIRLPFAKGGFVWTRPAFVSTVSRDGQETITPITDVTRLALFAILAGGAIGALLILAGWRHSRQ